MTDSTTTPSEGRPAAWDAPLSRGQRLLYSVIRAVSIVIAKAYFRVEMHGVGNLPPSGGYVLAPVHRSNLDAVLIQVITRRQLRMMGKDSLWKAGRFWAWLFTSLGGFPVARGTADRASLRAAQHIVEWGEPLVLFPEGTRQSGPVVQPLFDGPAFVACRSGVPIIPVGVGGSEAAMGKGDKIPKPKKVIIVFGPPLLPPPRPESGRVPRRVVQEVTAELHERVQAIFDEAQRLAGHEVPS